MKEYKKSYTGFLIILLLYLIAAFLPIFIPAIHDRPGAVTAWMCFSTAVFVFVIIFYIYKSEKLYLFSGVTFEQAAKLSSEQRRNYAYLTLKKFLPATVILIAYSVLAFIAKLPDALSIVILCLVLVAAAFSTMKIKVEEE
ncbi:MAG: hypothetical protein K6G72_10335 [Lachnospiraceae bacterium]|nr:hypothetical protein [Lachnospiraceae bacterium]